VQSSNLVLVIGQLSQWNGERRLIGKLGREFSLEEGQEAARLGALKSTGEADCAGRRERGCGRRRRRRLPSLRAPSFARRDSARTRVSARTAAPATSPGQRVDTLVLVENQRITVGESGRLLAA
jgi:hypothetical protein